MQLLKHFDIWSIVVIIITFVLFSTAIFVKGITHDILLETGVFLVSVKLILLGYKTMAHLNGLDKKIDDLKCALENFKKNEHTF